MCVRAGCFARDYRLTRRAAGDLLDIFLFGLEQFGEAQARRYERELDKAFRMLAENPRLGRSADRIAPGLRRHECGSHVILYEEDANGILVVALVHGRSVERLKI